MRLLLILAVCSLLLFTACSGDLQVTSTNNGNAPTVSSAWCTAGADYSQGTITSKIEGLEMFKGRQYCKASASLESDESTLDYTYYFNQQGNDVWVVVGSGNDTTETHLTN